MIIAVLVVVFSGGDPEETSTAGLAVTGPTAAQDTTNEARTLVREFLDRKNWAGSNLDSFLVQWNALPEETRTDAMQSIELNQLSTAIYKQLLEERALSGIGDAEQAINKQRQLIEFAEQIGINDPRLTMPD